MAGPDGGWASVLWLTAPAPAAAQAVTTTVAAGMWPTSVAVNPVTNKIYVANYTGNNVTVMTEQTVSAIPLTTTVSPLAGDVTYSPTPRSR